MAASASNYRILSDRWKQSLLDIGVGEDAIFLNEFDLQPGIPTSIEFRSHAWYTSIAAKIKHYRSTLPLVKTEFAVGSDCDVQFFPGKNKAWGQLLSYVRRSDNDIFFQPEDHVNLCTGFFIIHRSRYEDMAKVFGSVYDEMVSIVREAMPFADQTLIINRLGTIRAATIPMTYCVSGPHYFDQMYKSSYLFHHAICTSSLDEKLMQLELIRKKMLSS
jgi:hypothetical protein